MACFDASMLPNELTAIKYASMAQRAVRLFFHLHRVCCPNCCVFLEFNTLTENLPDAEKTCPQCSKAFLIVNGVGKPLKKRPHTAPESDDRSASSGSMSVIA